MIGNEPRKRPTVRDVAARAGVGTMTVSRVVTGRGYVSRETRARVEAAVAELGYVPNHQARGLRNRRSGTIALIVSDLTNPYFTTLARGAEDAARPHDSLLLIVSSDEDEQNEVRGMSLLVQKRVDGVLLVPSHAGTPALGLAQERGVPCVVVDRRGPPTFDCVRCDSEAGAAELAHLLRRNGHGSALILAAEEGVSTSDDRVRGFREAFGGAVETRRTRLTIEAGYRAALERLSRRERPTAVFAVNNFLAIGALRAIQDLGLACPEDVSVVGFDDLPAAMLAAPVLTVAHQPARELGRLAAERLLARIAEPDLPPEETILPTSLVERGSVGRPSSR